MVNEYSGIRQKYNCTGKQNSNSNCGKHLTIGGGQVELYYTIVDKILHSMII